MEGINWADLFSAMDQFLVSIVERNVLLVYVVLFLIFFSETGLVFMAFLPGDSLLFVAGAVAALPRAQAEGLNVVLLMVVITVAAVLGNTVNFWIGKWLGRKVYDGTIGWIDQTALRKTHDFYERHGGKTIVIARFVPVVRTFAPLVAGAGGMDVHKFQVFNVAGAALWTVSLVGGGYWFGNWPPIRDNLGIILAVGIAGVVVPLMVGGALKFLRNRRGGPAAAAAPVRNDEPRP